jgi:hypothetical protein
MFRRTELHGDLNDPLAIQVGIQMAQCNFKKNNCCRRIKFYGR